MVIVVLFCNKTFVNWKLWDCLLVSLYVKVHKYAFMLDRRKTVTFENKYILIDSFGQLCICLLIISLIIAIKFSFWTPEIIHLNARRNVPITAASSTWNSSAISHVVENTINIQILTKDLSVFSFFSWVLVFLCTVAAVLSTVHFKFMIRILWYRQSSSYINMMQWWQDPAVSTVCKQIIIYLQKSFSKAMSD